MPERQRGRDPNRTQNAPVVSEQERINDFLWISENIHILWPAAQAQFSTVGIGAVVVDTTVQPDPESGNPFGYIPQEFIENLGSSRTAQMVASYDPQVELVVVLLKAQGKVSTYQLRFINPSE